MKTLETPTDQTHLLNYGFEAPYPATVNTIHVQFNKATGAVETLEARGSLGVGFNNKTNLLTKQQKTTLAKYAREQYKKEYGHFPEHQPANA
jgi:hypothetical protein